MNYSKASEKIFLSVVSTYRLIITANTLKRAMTNQPNKTAKPLRLLSLVQEVLLLTQTCPLFKG